MIRIDEIYNHTFWPWLEKNCPSLRLFFCDPFGHTDPEHLFNLGRDDAVEINYIFLHDQEPVDVNLYKSLFDEVKNRNGDIGGHYEGKFWVQEFETPDGHIIVSEKGEQVEKLCNIYKWTPHYYFFHGWAALDWYRGYDKTFLIKPIAERTPTRTFISPNRIIAGQRQHRLEMLYWIFKLGLTDNYISCPTVCPAENINIYDAVKTLPFDDVEPVFRSAPLPLMFEGETDHPMHSCWLSLFDQSANSLLYLVTETVADGRRLHLTEKTFKPIALGMPFVLVSTAGSLEYLRGYGFRTFGHLWDESYDTITDPHERIRSIASLLRGLCNLSVAERIELYQAALPTIEHNWNHFYGGGFESVLWDELTGMLNGIKSSL